MELILLLPRHQPQLQVRAGRMTMMTMMLMMVVVVVVVVVE